MPRNVSLVRRWAVAVVAASAALALAGCATSGDATEHEPTATVAAAPTPVETPSSAPVTPVAPDPADVTTWVVTTSGMGPVVIGAPAADTVAGLTAFQSSEYCPGKVALSAEGVASVLVVSLEGIDEVHSVWVNGRPDAGGVVPASPATEAGIRLGSTMDELAAAYPELVPSNRTGPESQGYAIGDDSTGYINFLVENESVVLIGVQPAAGVPKEFCG